MTSNGITDQTSLLATILEDVRSKTCNPDEVVKRIDLLIKNYPEALTRIETKEKLCDITAILMTQQSEMTNSVQETMKQLFFRCHLLIPKRIKGLLTTESPAKEKLVLDHEASAFIRGKQNYPIPTSILKHETLPSNTYFRSLEVKLNDSCTRKISAGLLGYYSEMVGTMIGTTDFSQPTTLSLDMLDSHQFDLLIAYLETGNSLLLHPGNVIELLYAADYLQIPSLVNICKQFLIKQNDPLSILRLINFLKFHKSEVLVMVLEQKISDFLTNEFSKNELSDDFLAQLENLKKEVSEPLSISLAGSKIRDDQLHLLADIPIVSLDLSQCENLTAASFGQIEKYRDLRSLTIAMNPWVTDDVFPMIPEQVRSLSVEGCKQFTGIGLEKLSSSQVRQLDLFGCTQLTDEDLAMLPLQLEQIDLRHQQKLNEKGFKRLSEMINLHTLVLANIPLSKDLLSLLPVNLMSLDITLCFSEPGFLPYLAHLEHLEKLYTSSNPVKDDDIKEIPKNVSTLALVGCSEITDNGVEELGKRPALKELYLRHCPKITEDSIEDLPDSIKVDWDAPSALRLAYRR